MGKLADIFCTRCGNQKFVIKNVLADFGYYLDMQRGLGSSPYLRLLQDTIPGRSMFVYKYLKDHLLDLAQKDLPLLLTKRILKDALRGVAELHHQNIVHTGQPEPFHTATLLLTTTKTSQTSNQTTFWFSGAKPIMKSLLIMSVSVISKIQHTFHPAATSVVEK